MPKPNPMGSTFAERAAAARGDSKFDAPEVERPEAVVNTTFLERANVETKSEAKPAKKAAKKTAKSG